MARYGNAIYKGDCLPVLSRMDPECIDLIYLDPPFNSNRDYGDFNDSWTSTDAYSTWIEVNAHKSSAHSILHAAGKANGRGMQSYLLMLVQRLVEMRRVLKPTGSIYLHCDDSASHYLKMLMDAIFGHANYRNNLVWRRSTAHNDPKRFGRNVDHILYYVKTHQATWNGKDIRIPKTEEQLKVAYPMMDSRGALRSENLTGPRHMTKKGSPSAIPWRGYDVFAMGRVWAVPKTGSYAEYIEKRLIPGYRGMRGIHERLEALDAAGLIHHPKTGKWPGLKRYADSDRGNSPQSLILEPMGFTNYNKGTEYVDYPTQKPLALLEMIIKASSNPGDLVLDPFCGSGTTCVAAAKLGRRWIGIDLSEKATVLANKRLSELKIGEWE